MNCLQRAHCPRPGAVPVLGSAGHPQARQRLHSSAAAHACFAHQGPLASTGPLPGASGTARVVACAAAAVEAPPAPTTRAAPAERRAAPIGRVAPPAPASSKPLDQFAIDFELGEKLGQGTNAAVFAATDRATHRQYAVKMQTKLMGRRDRSVQIAREVAVSHVVGRSCRHAARLHAVYEDARSVYMVQDLCAGGDLSLLLAQHGPLGEPEAAALVRRVLEFLTDAHAANVCYGDVKPANFALETLYPSILHLLDPARPKGVPRLRVVDFGCCQLHDDEQCLPDSSITGTPLYMAPEILAGCHGKEVDVWATGVLLYQCLSGRFPFWDLDQDGIQRMGISELQQGIREGVLLFPKAQWGGISAEAQDLIWGMLQRNRSRRWSAEQALRHPWFDSVARCA